MHISFYITENDQTLFIAIGAGYVLIKPLRQLNKAEVYKGGGNRVKNAILI
jgi:hypothetical protein